MVSRNAVIAAGILLMAAAIFSSAFELGLSSDSVSASWCSNGQVEAWVFGATPGANAYFSVETDHSTASIPNPSTTVSSSGSAGAAISISVPQCTTGSQFVTVIAQVCKQGGACETQGRKLLVNAYACPGVVQCANTYSTGQTKILYPTPAPTAYCGSAPCSEVRSTVVREAYHLPTAYSAVLERVAAQKCISSYCVRDQLKPGETIALQLFARNLGAAGSFEVRADPIISSIVAAPKSVSFEMAAGERTAIDFLVTAREGSVAGSYALTFSLWHSGVKLDELTQWVEVVQGEASSRFPAKLVLPPGAVLNGCNLPPQVALSASLYNQGSNQQFLVNAQLRGQTVYSQSIAAGASQFQIVFDSSRLAQGDNWLEVNASSSEFEGSGRINVFVVACSAPSQEKLDVKNVFSSQSGNIIEIVAAVANAGTLRLEKVIGELPGLPSGWTQSSGMLQLAPGQEANLTIAITTSSADAVKPTLVLKNEGRVLATRLLGEINPQNSGGLTGLLFLGDATVTAIIAVLMLSAAALLIAASNQNEASLKNLKLAGEKRAAQKQSA